MRQNYGGETLKFIQACDENKLSFVRERLGSEPDNIIQDKKPPTDKLPIAGVRRFRELIKRSMPKCLSLVVGQEPLISAMRDWPTIYFKKPIIGEGCSSLHESGELHKWMYDSYSLSKLLERHAFADIE